MNEHPDRQKLTLDRWRLIKDGGDAFVEEYLVKRDEEDDTLFSQRKDITPDPCTASAAIDDLVNTLSARLDVTRSGGTDAYQAIISGKEGGVDRHDTDMQTFIIRDTLPELCYMSMCGWLINGPSDPNDPYKTPYIEFYKAEDIYNWVYKNNQLVAIGLRSSAAILDENGFSTESKTVFRVFLLKDGKVETHLEDENGTEIDVTSLLPGSSTEQLDLDEIPFVFLRLSVPLLQKIDKFQIAVLNLQSSDIDWLRTGNMVIYVEQTPAFMPGLVRESTDPTVTPARNEVVLGNRTGRSYAMTADKPDFIAPPAEPIKVSMDKQRDMADQVKEILKTHLNTMKLASSESIDKLSQGLEAGLFVIGVILLTAEIAHSRIFSKYEGRGPNTATIAYPKKYELRTEEARLAKAESLKQIQKKLGSNTAKKYIEIQIMQTLLEGKIPSEDYNNSIKEIMDSDFSIYDPEVLTSLVTEGIVSHQLASTTLGAPPTDSQVAQDEHIKRIEAVKLSQTSGMQSINPDPNFSEKIKKQAQGNNP